jgi:N-acetyl-alpha-D-muramate 1-phosphate uridylyltransferase
MRAMILAAGRGERMRPLTDTLPKPLLQVGGKTLIEWQLEKLAAVGIEDVVVNVSHLGELIEEFLGDGSRWGCQITYSRETEALETAGGIVQALPLLGSEPFLIVNADIWSNYDFTDLVQHRMQPGCLAHLVLVSNPPQHHQGDFCLRENGLLEMRSERGRDTCTYSGIALYHPDFFSGIDPGKLKLLPVLERLMSEHRVSGEHFSGDWEDVGTPERLTALDARLAIL